MELGAGVVRRSPTPPSRSRCRVSKTSRLRMHLKARLFSPDELRPRSEENLSLGGTNEIGEGSEYTCTKPWYEGKMADSDGFAEVGIISTWTGYTVLVPYM